MIGLRLKPVRLRNLTLVRNLFLFFFFLSRKIGFTKLLRAPTLKIKSILFRISWFIKGFVHATLSNSKLPLSEGTANYFTHRDYMPGTLPEFTHKFLIKSYLSLSFKLHYYTYF